MYFSSGSCQGSRCGGITGCGCVGQEDGCPPPREPGEIPVDVEEEDDTPEPQTPPSKVKDLELLLQSRGEDENADNPMVSDTHEQELEDDAERLTGSSNNSRQTRSKSRELTPPPSGPGEGDDKDELDIISQSPPHNLSPIPSSWRRTTSHRLSPQQAQLENSLNTENGLNDERLESHEAEDGEVHLEPVEDIEERPAMDERCIPPSPSTPSVSSPPKSPSVLRSPPEARESPIRAPKRRGPVIVDNTPLTPPSSPPLPIVIQLPSTRKAHVSLQRNFDQ